MSEACQRPDSPCGGVFRAEPGIVPANHDGGRDSRGRRLCVVAASPELVIRPKSGGAPDRTRLRFALAFLPLAAVGVARQFDAGLSSGLWYVGGFGTLALFVVLARADFFAQTSIRVAGGRVRRTGYLGCSASCPRDDIARVMDVNVVSSRLAGIPAKWLLFLDASDRTLMRAYAEYYPASELARLRDALDVSWDPDARLRTFRQVRRDIPGSFPWALAHIWITLAIIAALAIVIAGLIAGTT